MNLKVKNFVNCKDTEQYVILYCICVIASTIVRWMNYVNLFTTFIGLIFIIRTRRIKKRKLNWLWMAFIAAYPLLDAAVRGEAGLSLFTLLCYLPPLVMLAMGALGINEFQTIWLKFVKGFAWFQIIGMALSAVWNRLYTIVAWRLLGQWSYAVTGFTTDSTIAAYIISMAFGAYSIDAYLDSNESRKDRRLSSLKLVIMLLALIATNKRSFFISAIIVLMIMILVCEMNSKKKFVSSFLSFIAIVIVTYGICIAAYYLGSDNAIGRIGETIIGLKEGEDVSNMRSTWAAYLDAWRQGHEFLGIGWESFRNRIKLTPYDQVPNAHNVYRQIMCEEGYVGVGIFIILVIITITTVIRIVVHANSCGEKNIMKTAMFSMYVIIVFFIYSYSGNSIYDPTIYLYFFAAISLASSVSKENNHYGKSTH